MNTSPPPPSSPKCGIPGFTYATKDGGSDSASFYGEAPKGGSFFRDIADSVRDTIKDVEENCKVGKEPVPLALLTFWWLLFLFIGVVVACVREARNWAIRLLFDSLMCWLFMCVWAYLCCFGGDGGDSSCGVWIERRRQREVRCSTPERSCGILLRHQTSKSTHSLFFVIFVVSVL